MQCNIQDAIFRTPLLQFTYKQLLLPGFGVWSFLAETLEEPTLPCSVWHRTKPLQKFVNTYTFQIIETLQTGLRDWLDPHSMSPIAIAERFKLVNEHVLTPVRRSSPEESELEALQVVLDYMDIVAQAHGIFSDRHLPCHLRWSCDSANSDWPEPDLNRICDGPDVRMYIVAISLIMRYPGLYDGGVEFMHERTLEPTIKLLFSSSRLLFLSDEELAPIPDLPLLVAYASNGSEEEIRARLAKAAHPTLLRLVQIYKDRQMLEPLPSHCFVYGLHLSQTHLSVFVHFPLAVSLESESDHPDFCQVLAAKFLISYVHFMVNAHEDLMISRWRLVIALFAILRHVQTLELVIPVDPTSGWNTGCDLSTLSIRKARPTCKQTGFKWSGSYVARLRSCWEQSSFMVPSNWIAPEALSVDTARLVETMYMARDLQRQLGTLVMHHIRDYLKPLPDSVLTKNHASENYVGPDYLTPSQCPRAHYTSNSRERVNAELNTSAHFFRTRDFLTMAAPDWKGANIFVANVLAGFTMYRVQWKPIIRYPFFTSDAINDRCIVDFALAAETIFPTTSFTVNRAPRLPLTLTNPAMLLGFRSPNLDDRGPVISEEDMRALTEAMEPHLRVFRMLREYKDDIVIQEGPLASAEPTLFCTYLKNGFLHLLAFTYGHEQSSHISSLLLDSLPLSLRCETDEDLCDRMRIVIALFTLQREIIKISEAWGCICWPLELLVDEHEAIVEVTGQRSPSPSEAYVDDTPEWAWHDAYDYGVEDDEDHIKQEIARSVEIVLPWLAHLEDEPLPVGREHLPPVEHEYLGPLVDEYVY